LLRFYTEREGEKLSRRHNAAEMRDLLLDALDETGRQYELRDRSVGFVNETAVASIEMNGHTYTIMVREDD
jgi:hypothetical protein